MSFGVFLICHAAALICGFLLDLLIGDPRHFPHPIRWIGKLIGCLDKVLLGHEGETFSHNKTAERLKGVLLVVIVVGLTGGLAFAVLFFGYRLHPVFGVILEIILTWYILAARSLEVESLKVYRQLRRGNLEKARKAVSMIVGRDTAELDEAGVTKAAVETVAENTSDGVIAPLIYAVLFTAVGGLMYKAVNTMDSMVGYKNERYQYFGTAAARLDDVVNFIPSRLSALIMITFAFLDKKYFNGKNAWRIFKRDRYKHASPNSAQTESACAGAMELMLAGDAGYFGKIHHKPTIGDPIRAIKPADIKRAHRLMYGTEVLTLLISLIVILILIPLAGV